MADFPAMAFLFEHMGNPVPDAGWTALCVLMICTVFLATTES